MVCTIKNLSVRSATGVQLLSDVSYIIERNDFVVVLGSNGSGKTTMLKSINGSIKYNGQIKIDGIEVRKSSNKFLATHIATITQNVAESLFMDFSLMQNFEMYSEAFNQLSSNFQDFLEILNSMRPKLTKMLDAKISTLSGGERQCFLLGLNLFFKKALLLLDEHTSALDPKTSAEVMQITADKLCQSGITCIMTTHSLDDAIKYGNKLIAMKNGKISKVFSYEEKQKLSKVDLLNYCY